MPSKWLVQADVPTAGFACLLAAAGLQRYPLRVR